MPERMSDAKVADVRVRVVGDQDAAVLAALGRRTFVETFVEDFAGPYSAADLAAFLPGAFGEAAFAARLADPAMRLWVAETEGEVVGFASAGPCALPHPDVRPGDGELKSLYVAREAQGRGAGRRLLDAALTWLEAEGPRTLWIGVWSENLRAQAVYAARGFVKAGEYGFRVGSTVDREFILKRG